MKLDAISIITADMSAAVRFYSALGLDLGRVSFIDDSRTDTVGW
ncbi:hypothetical protein [Brevibacterium sp. 239c]|nr:hypothetical protein [Brevibacterium sp. 239c]